MRLYDDSEDLDVLTRTQLSERLKLVELTLLEMHKRENELEKKMELLHSMLKMQTKALKLISGHE